MSWSTAKLVVAAILAMSAAVNAAQPDATLCGDADGNGSVTITDGVNVLRAAAGLSSSCTAGCDVDASGSITVSDGVVVLRIAAGLQDDCSPTARELVDCTTISQGGRYTLGADLAARFDNRTPCLDIRGAADLVLDCGGHTIFGQPAIRIEDTQRFRIEHCHLVGTDDADANPAPVLTIRNGTTGTITGNTIGPAVVDVVGTNDLTVSDNHFDATYQQRWSSGLRFANNAMKVPYASGIAAALVISSYGAHNEIVDNVMDGNWNGVRFPVVERVGADDGIIVQDEQDDRVANNVVGNVWDCGIETSGLISDSTFENNAIDNAAFCGIGGWYWNGLQHVTIASNVVTGSQTLFEFFRYYGLRTTETTPEGPTATDTAVYFADNLFADNRFIAHPDLAGSGLPSTYIPIFNHLDYGGSLSSNPTERAPGPDDYVLENNVFRGNDFGTALGAPIFGESPTAGYVIDGGGNVCAPPSPLLSNYPLRCSP